MRINKYLAECGVASRRASEQFIIDGVVKVNGAVVKDLGRDIEIERDVVTVNGERVRPVKKYQYYMINKPKGCVTTAKDEFDRKTVLDFVKEAKKVRLFPVGRLDYDTEGLLILTNDGDLAYKLTHPKNEIPKSYAVVIEGVISESELEPLRKGVMVDGKMTAKAKAKITKVDDEQKTTRIELTITEGRNRQIRKMVDQAFPGRRIDFLKRIKIGDLKVGGLNRGEYRELRPAEIAYLYSL